MTAPQVAKFVRVSCCILEPRGRGRGLACATGKARQPLIDERQSLADNRGTERAHQTTFSEALRNLLAESDRLFDRGLPVRLTYPADDDVPCAVPLTKNNVVIETHRLCQPMKLLRGELTAVTLPDRAAQMYLDMVGEWHLPRLVGISTSPLLSDDGSLRVQDGYDEKTQLWCCRVPDLALPTGPSRAEAESALRLLRQTFRTFPFSDSERTSDRSSGIEVVDTSRAPGSDESAFLVALLTACCRSSLWLAPGVLLTAPTLSGAGCGKGLLVRAICAISFGVRPRAFTPGNDRHELDKRLAAELVDAHPVLFLDNANGVALRSDTLASALTERPARVRILGQTRMVPLNSSAFIAVTGNGLTLNARCEDPESRPFQAGFLESVEQRRAELLAALLTIWRWGCQNRSVLGQGKPLGSFERWAAWCRDPLLALGCRDPVERIEGLKVRDPRRQRVAELFTVWWENHGDAPVKANNLADQVKLIADTQDRGRQYLATYLASLAGTHAGGFVLKRQEGIGKWTPAVYRLLRPELESDRIGHRGHRDHRAGGHAETGNNCPTTPMTPMPYGPEGGEVPPGSEAKL
jgi:hypothetical protein